MQITEIPYTQEQYQKLNEQQRTAVDAVAEYLNGSTAFEGLSDEQLSEIFGILKPCQGSVPVEYIDEDVFSAMRKKFCAIYQAAIDLAAQALALNGLQPFRNFSFALIVDVRRDDASDIAVVDYHRPGCYLYQALNAWDFHFGTLAQITSAVLRAQDRLVQQVLALVKPEQSKQSIYVRVQGGLVQDIIGIPPGIEVLVLDYDIEDVEPERLQLSPLDQEACCISRF